MVRKEEQELLNHIKEYKLQLSNSLRKKLFNKREEKHKKGEVFFKGLWISQNKIGRIQDKLKKRGLIIFWEIHVLVFIVILFNFLLWIGFKRFLLP